MIRDTVQSLLTLQMDTLLGKVPVIIENAVSKGKTGKTIGIDIDDFSVTSCNILMGAKRMHFKVHTTFMAGLHLKHIHPGKELHIRPKGSPADTRSGG
jgi:uncharacterized membrane protein